MTAGLAAPRLRSFWSPVQTIDELIADPQFHAGGGVVEVPDGGFTTPMLATPADFTVHASAPVSRAPGLGQHTEEVLAELNRGELDS